MVMDGMGKVNGVSSHQPSHYSTSDSDDSSELLLLLSLVVSRACDRRRRDCPLRVVEVVLARRRLADRVDAS